MSQALCLGIKLAAIVKKIIYGCMVPLLNMLHDALVVCPVLFCFYAISA